jgi:hypothetical protein
MNVLTHHVLTVEFDMWEPFNKECRSELDTLINALKTKRLLNHCGNVKLRVVDETRV